MCLIPQDSPIHPSVYKGRRKELCVLGKSSASHLTSLAKREFICEIKLPASFHTPQPASHCSPCQLAPCVKPFLTLSRALTARQKDWRQSTDKVKIIFCFSSHMLPFSPLQGKPLCWGEKNSSLMSDLGPIASWPSSFLFHTFPCGYYGIISATIPHNPNNCAGFWGHGPHKAIELHVTTPQGSANL